MASQRNYNRIVTGSLASLTMLLSACASVPAACPSLPALTAREALGPSFQPRMDDFLSGKLPEPTGSGVPLKPATSGLTP